MTDDLARATGARGELERRIENDFSYHAPFGNQAARYVDLRQFAKSFAHYIAERTPPSREQSLALTNLEQAVFWANAAIARHEKEHQRDG